MWTDSLGSARRTLRIYAAVTGLVLGTAAQGSLAQNASPNAAQIAALARLAGGHATAASGCGGGEATNVSLDLPGGVAFDAAGDLFIADTNNHVIREVNLAGIIATVAGSGEQGFGGDGGAATSALLDSPVGVAVDSSGNIYIADTHNNRVREVSGGMISTIAGTGSAGFSGDGGPATAAALDLPTALAVDSTGNVYIADTNNHRIRQIAGTAIATVAGNGDQVYSGEGGPATSAGLDSPYGVAVDSAFNVYVGDSHNQRIRMVSHALGVITTLAGTGVKGFTANGPAAAAALALPRGLAVDGTGTVYVADSDNNRIRAITGGVIATTVGNGSQGASTDPGPASSQSLNRPLSVSVLGGFVAVSDSSNEQILGMSPSGTVNTVTGHTASGIESICITGPTTVAYGTGSLTATFASGDGNPGTGLVTFYDDAGTIPAVVSTASLANNAATLSTVALPAAAHSIVAAYAGDLHNPAVSSGIYVLIVAPAKLIAVANAVNMLYGQAVPALTGTLNGVLQQDSGNVTAKFTSTATSIAPVGAYPIAASLVGSASGNYVVALGSGSASVVIAQAPTRTTLTASAAMPVTFTASVASTTSGTPTGTVSIYDGTTLLNSTPATVSAGLATLTVATLPAGLQSITAVYSGDANFIASTSSSLPETGGPPPDFTIDASPAAQTILPGASANYSLTLTPSGSTFANAVSLSVGTLPAGVTATLTPSSIATGATASTSILSLVSTKQAGLQNNRPYGAVASTALALLLLPLAFRRRTHQTAARLSRAGRLLVALLLLATWSTLIGCGGGGFFSHPTTTSTVTITAASGTNTHSTSVTLTLQ